MSLRSLKMHFCGLQVNLERLWWVDSVLFLRLACQNTHPIKRFTRPAPQDLAVLQCVCVCVCVRVFMEKRANVAMFYLYYRTRGSVHGAESP